MTYSRALPEAMGYTVTMDEPAGYGVTRMLVGKAGTMQVWNPRDNCEQNDEVLCWLLARDATLRDIRIEAWNGSERTAYVPHNNNPAELRAAIVEAAERVAKA